MESRHRNLRAATIMALGDAELDRLLPRPVIGMFALDLSAANKG
jgi:hypothetical protein